MDISPYLNLMAEKNASDLLFTTNSPVKMRIEGRIVSIGKTVLTGDIIQAAAYAIMNDKQRKVFEDTMEADFAIVLADGVARFRTNVFKQRGTVAMVLRRIPSDIPTVEELGVPDILTELIAHKRGLILMVGATGSGKSTTLAAMIHHRNMTMAGHILTIEDPVEFSHPNQQSIVNQREIGVDTMSYRNALRAALRESPDVILIGEIRDRETMEAALELCNTGHLAISTLHANNANQAVERVINLFPQDMHKQVYMDLSLNVRAVIAQRLVPGVDRKRCAVVEIMVNTPHLAELIFKGELDELKAAMEDSAQRGMQTFDMALYNIYKEGRIDLEEALDNADSRTNLEARINFG